MNQCRFANLQTITSNMPTVACLAKHAGPKPSCSIATNIGLTTINSISNFSINLIISAVRKFSRLTLNLEANMGFNLLCNVFGSEFSVVLLGQFRSSSKFVICCRPLMYKLSAYMSLKLPIEQELSFLLFFSLSMSMKEDLNDSQDQTERYKMKMAEQNAVSRFLLKTLRLSKV